MRQRSHALFVKFLVGHFANAKRGVVEFIQQFLNDSPAIRGQGLLLEEIAQTLRIRLHLLAFQVHLISPQLRVDCRGLLTANPGSRC